MSNYKIGIIGSENSHTTGFAKVFNVAGEFPGVKVTHVGGRYPDESKKVAEECGIATVVDDSSQMLGQVDAIMITSRDGKYHLEYAKPFVMAGIPCFIDKPFTNDVRDALELIRLARQSGAPLCGGSMLRFAYGVQDMRRAVLEAGADVKGGTVSAPLHIDSPHGGFHFYAPHCAETTLAIFGPDALSATAVRNGSSVTAVIDYKSYSVSNHFIDGYGAYAAEVFLKDKPLYKEIDLSMCARLECEEFCEMIKSGKMKRTYEDLAAPVYYVNAVKESYETGKTVRIGGRRGEE